MVSRKQKERLAPSDVDILGNRLIPSPLTACWETEDTITTIKTRHIAREASSAHDWESNTSDAHAAMQGQQKAELNTRPATSDGTDLVEKRQTRSTPKVASQYHPARWAFEH